MHRLIGHNHVQCFPQKQIRSWNLKKRREEEEIRTKHVLKRTKLRVIMSVTDIGYSMIFFYQLACTWI